MKNLFLCLIAIVALGFCGQSAKAAHFENRFVRVGNVLTTQQVLVQDGAGCGTVAPVLNTLGLGFNSVNNGFLGNRLLFGAKLRGARRR